jgi:DNA-binding NarL/FixJ family response regulator
MAPKRSPAIKVLVVDDHRTFAEALALAIGLEKGFDVRVAASGNEAVQAAELERPDVVLMDSQMPGMDGIEAIRRVREIHSGALVLVLSAHDEDLMKARAIEAGAVGHIPKETPLSDVPEYIRRAHRGDILIEQHEIHRLLRMLHHRRHQESTERQRANRLSPRQLQILQMIAEGATNHEIAGRLGTSPLTVRTHVQNILMRLAVHTKLEAVAMGIRHGKVVAEGRTGIVAVSPQPS